MCFSENMSLIIGLSGLASGVYFAQKNSYAAIGIAYFSLMEIIQYFQSGERHTNPELHWRQPR